MRKCLLAAACAATVASPALACRNALMRDGEDYRICSMIGGYDDQIQAVKDAKDRAETIAKIGAIKDRFDKELAAAATPADYKVLAAKAMLAKVAMAVGIKNAKKRGFF